MQLSRRLFLASAGALPLLATTPSIARTRPWYQKMRRCGEINFDETGTGPLDVAACVEYWSILKVDALLVSAGGKMAYYPTNIPGHHRSERIGARDLFGDFAMAAKARGIRVVARLDCNLAHQETLQLRPEWFVRSPGGQPVKQDGSPWLYQTCMFTGYFTRNAYRRSSAEMNSLAATSMASSATGGPAPASLPRAVARPACGSRRGTQLHSPNSIWRACWKSGSCGTTRPRRKRLTACTQAAWEQTYEPPRACRDSQEWQTGSTRNNRTPPAPHPSGTARSRAALPNP